MQLCVHYIKKEINQRPRYGTVCLFFPYMVHLVDTWKAEHALNCHRDMTNYNAVSLKALVIQ